MDVYRTPILMIRILIRSPEYYGSYTTTVLSPGERSVQQYIAPGYVPNRYTTSRTDPSKSNLFTALLRIYRPVITTYPTYFVVVYTPLSQFIDCILNVYLIV